MFKSYSVIFVSMFTRSIAMGTLTAFPREDLAPLIDWIAERSSEKAKYYALADITLLCFLTCVLTYTCCARYEYPGDFTLPRSRCRAIL